jgi:hypothetical protein
MPVSPAAAAAQKFAETYGALVTGSPKTLPASGSGDIFNVVGGRVIVTSLTGAVTTAIQAQACTISVGNKPSGGSSATTTLSIASASVSGLPVGASLAVPQAKTSALILSAADGTLVWNGSTGGQGFPVTSGGLAIVPAGTVQITTSATNTGAIQWSITYVPYDTGAFITAA